MSSLTRRLAVAIGVAQALAYATTYYIPATMVGTIAASLHLSPTLLLGGFSWSLLVAGLCAPRVGRAIDRHGGRPMLIAAALVTSLGLLLLAAASGAVLWYVAWSVLGVGMAMGLYDAAFSTIGRLLGQDARPAIVGVTLLGGFASTVGWPTGTFLVAHLGWRAALLVFAAVQLGVILPITLRWVPPIAPQDAASAKAAPGHAGVAPAPLAGGRRAAFILLAVYFTLRAAIFSIISVHALTLLARLGMSPAGAVFTASLIGPAQVGARVLDWKFARGLNPLVTSWLGAALLPIGFAALIGGAPPAVFALAYGMSNGILTISRGTLPMHLFGPEGYATLLGRLALPNLLAQAAAPTLLAPLIGTLPASWTFAGLLGVSVLVSLCLVPLRR
ncbi:MAG: MFS transporter [Rhodospirillales bacterium]|nr:MFS transporter [Rhodospirillales bacterium]